MELKSLTHYKGIGEFIFITHSGMQRGQVGFTLHCGISCDDADTVEFGNPLRQSVTDQIAPRGAFAPCCIREKSSQDFTGVSLVQPGNWICHLRNSASR